MSFTALSEGGKYKSDFPQHRHISSTGFDRYSYFMGLPITGTHCAQNDWMENSWVYGDAGYAFGVNQSKKGQVRLFPTSDAVVPTGQSLAKNQTHYAPKTENVQPYTTAYFWIRSA